MIAASDEDPKVRREASRSLQLLDPEYRKELRQAERRLAAGADREPDALASSRQADSPTPEAVRCGHGDMATGASRLAAAER